MKDLLAQLVAGHRLDEDQAHDLFEQIMTGKATPAQTAAALAMIQLRGPATQELLGAARVMRAKATAVTAPDALTIIDTCGTGGDHSGTFNISTAAAIVAAAAGRPRGVAVAKHGNRSVTSRSGSSQVLEALGVTLRVQPETLTRCLDEAGLCFCFAPAHHPAMKHAVEVRQQLAFRTLFNLLGPLTNPAGALRQVIGVFDPDWTEPIAHVLAKLGSAHAMVVHGRIDGASDQPPQQCRGLDELTITGPTRVSHLQRGKVRTYEVHPQDLGLTVVDPSVLCADGPEASAEVIRGVLRGEAGPARQIVGLNAAAALLVADVADDLLTGFTMATEVMDSGVAEESLQTLVRVTQAGAASNVD